jgi:HNH endonuclease/Domain of unknown function (DUF222)
LAAALDPLMRKRGEEDDRTPPQRRADALLELTDIALRSAALPDCGGDRPRLTFLVRTAAPTPLGDTTPGDTTPADTTPADTTPADTTPADTTPADTTPADTTPADTTPADTTPADTTPAPLAEVALGDVAGAVTGAGPGAAFSASQIAVSAFADPDSDHLLLGTTAMLPAQTIARIGCDADINTATVNAFGEILNYHRTRRDPPPHQRRAVVLRDKHGVFPHCDRPASACQCHHVVPWSQGGPTNINNLALACLYHHHLVHEGGWRLQRLPPDHPATATPPAHHPAGSPPHPTDANPANTDNPPPDPGGSGDSHPKCATSRRQRPVSPGRRRPSAWRRAGRA